MNERFFKNGFSLFSMECLESPSYVRNGMKTGYEKLASFSRRAVYMPLLRSLGFFTESYSTNMALLTELPSQRRYSTENSEEPKKRRNVRQGNQFSGVFSGA